MSIPLTYLADEEIIESVEVIHDRLPGKKLAFSAPRRGGDELVGTIRSVAG